MWMKVPSAELQIASDGSGRVSFVMKGLASDRNNACVPPMHCALFFGTLFRDELNRLRQLPRQRRRH
jgi:hypothetical protein